MNYRNDITTQTNRLLVHTLSVSKFSFYKLAKFNVQTFNLYGVAFGKSAL